MGIGHHISRRKMLAMSVAAGGMAIGVGRASAQAEKRIEQLDPALDKIIATSEPIKELADEPRRKKLSLRPSSRIC